MPDLGPGGRGGARRRTRRRVVAVEEMRHSQDQPVQEQSETVSQSESQDNSDKLEKLAKLLKSKGVITEEEFSLIFE